MRILFLICLLGSGLVACSEQPVGSRQRPFTMYFVPSVDAQEISTHSVSLERHIEKFVSQKLYGEDRGFYVRSAVPTSYVAVVEAFGTRRADFAFFTTFAYVLATDIRKYDVEPLFTVARGPNADEHTYKAQFITRADSDIKTLADLRGKRFAYVDPASTSGYILPSRRLADENVEIGNYVFAQGHGNVVTMVYQGQVDAGAAYYSPPERVTKEDGTVVEEIRDARMRVLTQFPDVEEKIRVIGFSDEVPNEPWVIRGQLYEDQEMNDRVKGYIREALLAFVETKEGKEALWTVSTGTGLVPATAATYDRVRKMILESEFDVSSAVR